MPLILTLPSVDPLLSPPAFGESCVWGKGLLSLGRSCMCSLETDCSLSVFALSGHQTLTVLPPYPRLPTSGGCDRSPSRSPLPVGQFQVPPGIPFMHTHIQLRDGGPGNPSSLPQAWDRVPVRLALAGYREEASLYFQPRE
jgi:hypothetical protein